MWGRVTDVSELSSGTVNGAESGGWEEGTVRDKGAGLEGRRNSLGTRCSG